MKVRRNMGAPMESDQRRIPPIVPDHRLVGPAGPAPPRLGEDPEPAISRSPVSRPSAQNPPPPAVGLTERVTSFRPGDGRRPPRALGRRTSAQVLDLDGTWRFHLSGTSAGTEGFAAPQFDDGDWDHLPVPSCWQIAGLRDPAGTLLPRSEEHTSELQSRGHVVCRPLRGNKQATWT